MKKIILFAAFAMLVAACNKVPKINSVQTVTSTAPSDTFTLTDNGITYKDSEGVASGVQITIEKTNSNSFFTMLANPKSSFPVEVRLENVTGPLNSIGEYKMTATGGGSGDFTFVETFNGGEAYTIDSAVVNITSAAVTTVIGSYQIWLSNIAGSKSVTGIIKCYSANIE